MNKKYIEFYVRDAKYDIYEDSLAIEDNSDYYVFAIREWEYLLTCDTALVCITPVQELNSGKYYVREDESVTYLDITLDELVASESKYCAWRDRLLSK